MKTKSKKGGPGPGPAPTAPASIDDFRTASATVIDEPKKKDRFQLSFDLNEDGSPDLEGMREGTKRKVAEFFQDPKIASAFGARTVEATPPPNFFPTLPNEKYPTAIGSLYNVLGMLETLSAQLFFKIPGPVAQRAFMYTEMEKEALAVPTVKVLNKHMPDWMIRYYDEIMLGSMLLSMTMAKVQFALALKAQFANTSQVPRQEQSEENGKKEGGGTPVQ